jgi:hypothetical protein
MTEYDYSPEAYEKYLANQARIARWVNNTQKSRLVAPDVPPTPLGVDENALLPRKKERKSRSSRPSSPFPEEPSKSSRRKRSKSVSARRPPTPSAHEKKELPFYKDFVPTAEAPEPGCPYYHVPWSSEPPKAPSPSPSPPPEPSFNRERRISSVPVTRRNSPEDSAPSQELPNAYASYFPHVDSGKFYSPSPERVMPYQPAGRKRSMSFSVVASRPLNHSPPALHHYSDNPHHASTPRNHSRFYSSHNSSPHYPPTSSVPFRPPPPVHTAPVPGRAYPQKNFSYPLPHQQYPQYDALRRRELSRSHTAPAHGPHYSIDSTPYRYDASSYPHEQKQPVELAYQQQQLHHYNIPSSSPQSSQITTDPQPNSIPVTFPNGRTLYMNLPNADRSEILKVRFILFHFPKSIR